MSSQFLSQKYHQWLQGHPDQARQIRKQLLDKMKITKPDIHEDAPLALLEEVFEISQCILLSLRDPNENIDITSKDLLAFSTSAQRLALCYEASGLKQKSKALLEKAEHQLISIMPLFASNMPLVVFIQSLIGILQSPARVILPSNSTLH